MKRFSKILSLAFVVVLLDRLSKMWVIRHFQLGESRPLAPFFHLTYLHNTGTAFGLFQNNNRLLLYFAFTLLIVLVYAARGLCERGGAWAFWGVLLVLGGAVGNIIDRIHYGRVVDFLDFRVWPVFNLADSAITVGTFCLAVGLLKIERQTAKS